MLREGVNEASKICIQLGPTLHINLLFNPHYVACGYEIHTLLTLVYQRKEALLNNYLLDIIHNYFYWPVGTDGVD